METQTVSFRFAGWAFGFVLLAIGIANLILVHAVPGTAFLLFSLLYFPPSSDYLYQKTGLRIPTAVKVIFGIILIWFTLGISDLGDIIS